MTFRRFLIWLGERLIEWQLAIALLLSVKFLLPVAPESYIDIHSFIAGVHESLGNNLADAAFMTQNFMNGDWGVYWAKAWRAAGWIIGTYIYLQGLYLFTSLLARQIAPHRPIRGSALAFLVSFAVLCGLHGVDYDLPALRLAVILLVGGLAIVALSTAFGKLFDDSAVPVTPSRTAMPRGPVFFDNDQADAFAAVADPQPSVLRRKRLYFSD